MQSHPEGHRCQRSCPSSICNSRPSTRRAPQDRRTCLRPKSQTIDPPNSPNSRNRRWYTSCPSQSTGTSTNSAPVRRIASIYIPSPRTAHTARPRNRSIYITSPRTPTPAPQSLSFRQPQNKHPPASSLASPTPQTPHPNPPNPQIGRSPQSPETRMRPQGPQARTALPLECAFALRQQSRGCSCPSTSP